MGFSLEHPGTILLQLVQRIFVLFSALGAVMGFYNSFLYQSPESSKSDSSSVTPEMIKRNLPVMKYNEEMVGNLSDCAVCLSQFKEGDWIAEVGSCGHVYHKDCIERWVENDRNMCPLCRSPLLMDEGIITRETSKYGWVVENIAYLFGEDL